MKKISQTEGIRRQALLGTLPDNMVAAALGLSRSRVTALRIKARIPRYLGELSKYKILWDSSAFNTIANHTDKKAAKILGATEATIRYHRKKNALWLAK